MNRSTKIIWEKDTGNLEELFRNYIERYPYLKEEKYCHKREQLYLMLQYGMSEAFIKSFFEGDENIISRDLDFVRMIAMLFGENFVTENFYKKEYNLEKAKEILTEKVVQIRCAGLPKLEELLQEQKWMKERFELQCEFLEKERERTKEHFQELLTKETELMEERSRNEKIQLEEKLKEAENEKQRLLKKCGELKELLEQADNHVKPVRGKYFTQLQNKKELQKKQRENEERNQFIMTVLSNPDFSKEQLEFIIQAVQSELTLPELRQMCNPKLPVKSMELLRLFYLKQREGNEG